ncbi:MAG: helix-turn-helix transcriptional regulator [Eubacteriales bacterium]|nr:helix-turn-helix transcriptional regulator [Eubacterium sp.]MDD7180430.1 helix-turn-helix transcriptional regulator [Eubacterium sp.]MDD7573334.1 helix-turn-helix transcriptional regulator [Eubacteriales bacterium]MDY5493208.1 helix-turn-helix transcriptional regulator [Eubacteriales bacterium]
MNSASIGKRIRTCREQKGWTQQAFAEKVGISIAYTGMIERGEKIPKLETFIRIANVLEVSADLLLADVIKAQPFSDTSARAEVVNSLSKESRERIYDVIDTLLRHEKR